MGACVGVTSQIKVTEMPNFFSYIAREGGMGHNIDRCITVRVSGCLRMTHMIKGVSHNYSLDNDSVLKAEYFCLQYRIYC